MSLALSTITSPGSTINSLTGKYGARFTNRSGVNVTLVEVGRWVTVGNSQIHAVEVYDTTRNLIDTIPLNCSGAPSNAFLWGTLTSPITVLPGDTVYAVSPEVAGTEKFSGPNGQIAVIADIGVLNPVSLVGSTWNDITNDKLTYGPVSFKFSSPVATWTYDVPTNTYITTPDFYQVKSAAVAAASTANATIDMGTSSGTATWFAGGAQIVIPPGVWLKGSTTPGGTVITMSPTSSVLPAYSAWSLNFGSGSKVSDFTLLGPDVTNAIPFLVSTGSAEWEVSRIVYTQVNGRLSYFIYGDNIVSGLITGCTITGGSGSSELIYLRGPTDAWNVAHTMGTANNVFVEKNIFNGNGYVCDGNANARMVIRFNRITGDIKIDGHGLATNSPPQGVRCMEVYCNEFASTTGVGWTALEIRGGNARVFNNTTAHPGGGAAFYFTEYGCLNLTANFGNVWQTPSNNPVGYQMGTGTHTLIPLASVVQYLMIRILTLGTTTNWQAMGAPVGAVVGTQFIATGPGSGDGTATTTPVSEPCYAWGNRRGASAWTRNYKTPNSGAITTYRNQTGNPSITFTDGQIVRTNEHFYADSGFDLTAAAGVVVGPDAAKGSAVGKLRQGYAATDGGSWNTENNTPGAWGYQKGNDVLYVSDNTNWVLDYVPYTFPYANIPPTTPGLSSAEVIDVANLLDITITLPVKAGTGGFSGVTLAASGGAVTWTYLSGSGTETLRGTLSRLIALSETLTISYTQPGDGIQSVSDNVDLPSFSLQPVINNSTYGLTINVTTLSIGTLTIA